MCHLKIICYFEIVLSQIVNANIDTLLQNKIIMVQSRWDIYILYKSENKALGDLI